MPLPVTAPWGTWEVLTDGPGYKVKRITVNAGHRLSYQKHCRRSEHWVLVQGSAVITLDGREMELNAGEHIEIACGRAHRIAGRGREPVVFIEVQLGNACEEDDIVRIEDDYGRTRPPG
jgi:mannose-6-phosphate isomerase-like protein (cupin superfamily)